MKSIYKLSIDSFQKIVFLIFWGLLFFSPISQARYQYTASDVYTETLKIKREIEIIQKHFKVAKIPNPERLDIELKPGNAWQKTYEIFVKINILRAKYKLPRLEEAVLEPIKNVSSWLVYEQIIRILAELDIFKTYVGITEQTKTIVKQQGKTSTDVYYLLDIISSQLDSINGKDFTPSFVFAQNMRILEDINTILKKLNINDFSNPPNRLSKTIPKDVFKTSLLVLEEISRLQTIADIDVLDFNRLKKAKIAPKDVFAMSGIIISSLQPIKAYLRLNQVTPAAMIYEGKEPADALQVLGWALRKIKQIKHLD